MLRKFPSGKINGAKNALFFLSLAPTHRNLTFNLRCSRCWSTMFVSLKLCVGFSILDSDFFLKFIFCLTKFMDSLTLNIKNPFKIKLIDKSLTFLLTDV